MEPEIDTPADAAPTTGRRYSYGQGKGGKWYWTLIEANGEPVADGAQGYKSVEDCLHGIDLARNSKDAPVLFEPRPRLAPKRSKKRKARK